MKLTKAPQSMVDLFEAVFPGPPAESRKMFGYPAGFVNGNMFMGLFQDYMVLRLPEDVREELIEKSGARRFEPMPGRAMTEYVVVSGSLISDRAALKKRIAQSLTYAASIPRKANAGSARGKTRRKR